MKLFLKRVTAICMLMLMILFIGNNVNAAGEKQQIKKVEQQRLAIKQKINSLAKLERQEANKLSRNQQKLEKNQQALKRSQNQLKTKQDNIASLQKELNTYLNQYNKRHSSSAERIRTIYKTKHTLVLDLLISTDSLSQFLDRIYYQNLIIQSDKNKMIALKEEAQKVASLKQRLETEKKQLARIIKDIDRENSNIKVTINQNKSMIERIQKDKKAYEKSERELKRQSDRLAAMISKSTRHSNLSTSGAFRLPVSGARISSPFGWRVHPIFKSKIYHTGIDYAIAYGTPIRASNSGKVIFSGWYGGYGKVVIIDHGMYRGSPTSTLYAHMSKQAVSVGQHVSQGEVIGYVGSTGYSTGPHVHFEVRVNGKPQNPKNFL
ncbi:peptidoglycan DD-metalloendopeptidase family protein [bacterium]|nr:peptidoglycan DD-metalloendopeptidase family protein [bacterium]